MFYVAHAVCICAERGSVEFTPLVGCHWYIRLPCVASSRSTPGRMNSKSPAPNHALANSHRSFHAQSLYEFPSLLSAPASLSAAVAELRHHITNL